MAGFVVNAAEALEARKPLPPGTYHAVFTGSKLTLAPSADKADMLSLEFTIHDDEGPEFAGKTCFRNLVATLKAIPFAIDAALALGADPEVVTAASVDFPAVFKELHGNECWLETSIREFTPNRPGATKQEQTNVEAILPEAPDEDDDD